jgi:hypothetical protein
MWKIDCVVVITLAGLICIVFPVDESHQLRSFRSSGERGHRYRFVVVIPDQE